MNMTKRVVCILEGGSGTPVVGPVKIIDGEVYINVLINGEIVPCLLDQKGAYTMRDAGTLLIAGKSYYVSQPGFEVLQEVYASGHGPAPASQFEQKMADLDFSVRINLVEGSLRVESEAGEFVLVCDVVDIPKAVMDPDRFRVKRQVAGGIVSVLVSDKGCTIMSRMMFPEDVNKDELSRYAAEQVEKEIELSKTNKGKQKKHRKRTKDGEGVTPAMVQADYAAWHAKKNGYMRFWAGQAMTKFGIKARSTLNKYLTEKE